MSPAILQYLSIAACILGAYCQEPEVEIPQGRLKGRSRKNWNGGAFYSFQNIPFGKPPLGNLRFKAPQPADGWEGTRDATEDLPACIQMYGGGQEDCLYLNVYTPELPGSNISQKAVMVWIYGGGFVQGSAQESFAGPEFLLTKDVVLVTLNYRVGIFGFLSLDDPNLGVTGNSGLKDQVLALKWIKDNIQYFRGDPNNVLIFGGSAGGMSVHLQVLSPMSQGLFHKAISQSGSALTDFIIPSVRNNGVILAEKLGIQTENWEDMLESLQDMSSELLSSGQLKILGDSYKSFFTPTVEISSSEPSFISKDPIDIIKSGSYNQVPHIMGFNSAEGLFYEMISKLSSGQSILITNFSEWIPRELQIQSGSEEELTLSRKIKNFYYGNSEPIRDDITNAVYLTGDHTFGFPAYRSALEHLQTALHPIYFYVFNASTKLSICKQALGTDFPGAAHGEDVAYLFHLQYTPSSIEEGSVEDVTIKNMVDLWTNFAIFGNPTPDGFAYKWEPVQENRFNYLYIDTEESTLQVDPEPERFKFWWKIYTECFPKKN